MLVFWFCLLGWCLRGGVFCDGVFVVVFLCVVSLQ